MKKTKGRGSVELKEPPTNANDQTLVVKVEDSSGGDDLYEFHIEW